MAAVIELTRKRVWGAPFRRMGRKMSFSMRTPMNPPATVVAIRVTMKLE